MPEKKRRHRRPPSTPPTARDQLTVNELVAEFPVSRQWVYARIRDGELEARKYGRRVVVSREAFQALGLAHLPTHAES